MLCMRQILHFCKVIERQILYPLDENYPVSTCDISLQHVANNVTHHPSSAICLKNLKENCLTFFGEILENVLQGLGSLCKCNV